MAVSVAWRVASRVRYCGGAAMTSLAAALLLLLLLLATPCNTIHTLYPLL
jgi:hypothetical protein